MTIQAVFTPTALSAINIMTFPLQTKLEYAPVYRQTENQGLKGNYSIFLENKTTPETVVIVGLSAIYATMKAAENIVGTLNIRGDSISTVRLLSVKYLEGLGATVTPGTPISISYTYCRLECVFMKEPA